MTITGSQAAELLARHGLAPSKVFGQNFVVDPNTVRRIARLAGVGSGDRVLEIGPGLGSLTVALAETGASVTAVEIDRDLVPIARETTAGLDVTIVEADAMAADWGALLGEHRWVMVANLPYNISTPLVLDLLDGVPAIERMLVMVQREAGERLAAPPGDRTYGAVSVKVAYWATAAVVAKVPATVFLPRPNVESVLVRIDRRPTPAVDPALATTMFELVRMGFAKRRKMLRGSLAGRVGAAQFESAGIDGQQRAEQLSVLDWGRLAAVVQRGQR